MMHPHLSRSDEEIPLPLSQLASEPQRSPTFGEKFEHPPKRGQVNPELKPCERPEVTIGSRPRRAVTGPDNGGVQTAFRSSAEVRVDS
jgi:hypothetical protein